MSVTFAREPFDEAQEEFAEFVDAYWYNTPENVDLEPLDWNWPAYYNIDKNHSLCLFTGRENEKIICAALYIVTLDLKRRTKLVALCDTFAVALAHRNKGLAKLFFAFVEAQLFGAGIDEIHNMYREVYNTTPVFEKLGFELVERGYVKKRVD